MSRSFLVLTAAIFVLAAAPASAISLQMGFRLSLTRLNLALTCLKGARSQLL